MARGKGGKRKGKAQEGADRPPSTEAPDGSVAEQAVAESQTLPSEGAHGKVPTPESQKEPSLQKLARADPDDQEMTLDEAAGAMVDGFKESWLPAIRAKARSMGAGDKASRRVWRGIFVAWGGPSILR